MVSAKQVGVVSKSLNIGRVGMKTSEFWVVLITAMVAVLVTYGSLVVPWQAVTVVVIYVISRTVLKSTVAKNGGN